MRFHHILEDLMGSKLKISALKVLVRFPKKKFTGSELARLMGVSISRVIEILELFHRYGVVYRTKVGKTGGWGPNEKSIIIKLLSPILEIEKRALESMERNLKRTLAGKKEILKVVLFGSVLKGEEKPESDIDIFVLVKEGKNKKIVMERIDKLNHLFLAVYGNAISAVIYSKKELAVKKSLALVKHIESEGEVLWQK